MFDSVGNFYFGESLQHYGVIGMHWGVRRYQPYETVPRGSGEGGKEIGQAAKIAKRNKKIATGNIRSAYKYAASKNAGLINDAKYSIDKKIYKAHMKGDEKKADKWRERREKYANDYKTKDSEAALKEMYGILENADKILGKEKVDKILKRIQSESNMSGILEGMLWLPWLQGYNNAKGAAVYREVASTRGIRKPKKRKQEILNLDK